MAKKFDAKKECEEIKALSKITIDFVKKDTEKNLIEKIQSLLVDYGTLEKYNKLTKEESLKEIYKKISDI